MTDDANRHKQSSVQSWLQKSADARTDENREAIRKLRRDVQRVRARQEAIEDPPETVPRLLGDIETLWTKLRQSHERMSELAQRVRYLEDRLGYPPDEHD